MQVRSQWKAQTGRWQRPHQLDDVEFDDSNKAKAAPQVKASSKPTSIPMLGMLFARLPFLVGTFVLPRCYQIFGGGKREMDLQETTRKNKFLFYRTSTHILGNMPLIDVLRNKSERIISLII
jgi:hypothetical protein